MTPYSSIEEVNAALIELEENERINSVTDKANSEKHSDSEKPSRRTKSDTIVTNGERANGAEENGGLHDENPIVGESDTDSGSGTLDPEGPEDEEELDEENHDDGIDTEDDDDEDDEAGPASDEEDEVHVRQKVAQVDPEEEAEFDRELRALMQASFQLIYSFLVHHGGN